MPDNTSWTTGKIWTALGAAFGPLIISMILGLLFKSGNWYKCLNKPCFTPPGWVFGVVWTILYPLLGLAMVAACYGTDNNWTWVLPVANILIGLTFSPLMFGFRSVTLGALVTVNCLLMGIGLMFQYQLANNSTLATVLTIPYVLWLCLASAIAVGIILKNPDSKIQECERIVCKNTSSKRQV